MNIVNIGNEGNDMAQQQNRRAPVRKTKKQIRRQRQLTVVGVVVVIFLIIFGMGAAFGASRAGSVKAEDIATTVQGLGQTVQVDYDYTKVLTEEDRTDAYYGWNQAADLRNFTIMYQGSVDIGSDTSTLTADKVKIDGKTVTITLPAIKVLQHDIAQDSVSYYDSDEKIFRQIELSQFDSFCADQKSAVENELYNTDKFSAAETRLKNVIDQAVKAMGNFTTVTVNFE